MQTYTEEQINGLIDYVNYSVKEGFMDEGTAIDLVMGKRWELIEDIRNKGDYSANMEGSD